ncbi:hypothetical protein [Micromonospora sp. NPDC023956]|uniref:hypothetical protein n=1 Tax=Micromonospora sp. NPDC023956 TaxID=3155722 RepID=UPI0033E6F970
MSYRQALDEAIGQPPVSTVDIDRIISGQRRARKLRIWGTSGAGAAAVLAVTLTAGLLGGPEPSPTPPAAPPSPSPSVPPVPSHPPAPKITTVAGSEADWQRLEAAVEASLKRVAPGIRWPKSTAPDMERPGWQAERGGWTTLDQFSVSGDVAADGKRGHLLLVVRRQGLLGFHSGRCERELTKVKTECTEMAGPAGSRIRISSRNMGSRVTPPREVQVLRADNSALHLVLQGHTTPGPLPFTVEQMLTIATDPTLNLGTLPPGVEMPVQTLPPSVPADPAQQERLDKAVFAALRAQLPDVTSDGSKPLEEGWTGNGGDNNRDNYWGQANLTTGGTRGLFSVQIWRKPPDSASLTCGKPTGNYSCRIGTGPNGEQYRFVTNLAGRGNTPRTGERMIDVRRPDGSRLHVSHSSGGPGPTFALTEQQQLAVALSPTLTLTAR